MEREDQTQQEIREDAAAESDDQHTSREEAELDLMESDASEAGEHLGDPSPNPRPAQSTATGAVDSAVWG